MEKVVFILLLATFATLQRSDVVSAQSTPSVGPIQLTDGEKTIILQTHNDKRAAVLPPAANMEIMTYSEELAVIAQAYSQECVFNHNPELQNLRIGENLLVQTATGVPIPDYKSYINNSWGLGEKINYDFDSNVCRQGQCGHYTQLVWYNSDEVGCGATVCESVVGFSAPGPIYNFVCNYRPPGNVNGARPFTSGERCSLCPTSKPSCVLGGLCAPATMATTPTTMATTPTTMVTTPTTMVTTPTTMVTTPTSEEPLQVFLTNNSPVVNGRQITVTVGANKPVDSIMCSVLRTELPEQDCTSGPVTFNIPADNATVVVSVLATSGSDTSTERVKITLEDTENKRCFIHLTNSKVTMDESSFNIHFASGRPDSKFLCSVDNELDKFECRSPVCVHLRGFNFERHSLYIQPDGVGCENSSSRVFDFRRQLK